MYIHDKSELCTLLYKGFFLLAVYTTVLWQYPNELGPFMAVAITVSLLRAERLICTDQFTQTLACQSPLYYKYTHLEDINGFSNNV